MEHFPVGNNGFVKLVDLMPRVIPEEHSELQCDYAIVQAARVSYSGGTTQKNTDKGLIKYLLKNGHTTPFEMVQFKFHIKAPLFVIRQWQRHRMSSYNELSARYSVIEDSFWIPETFRVQDNLNKQSSHGSISDELNKEYISLITKHQEDSYKLYQKMLDDGICREMARTVLPVSINSEFYWKIDLHNLLRFIGLRSDGHAQFEIREYSDAIKEIVKKYCPVTFEAFEEYSTDSVRFSKSEINALQTGTLPNGSKSSQKEFIEKANIIKLKDS